MSREIRTETVTLSFEREKLLSAMARRKLIPSEFDHGDVHIGNIELDIDTAQDLIEIALGRGITEDAAKILKSAAETAAFSIEESRYLDALNEARWEAAETMFMAMNNVPCEYCGETSEGDAYEVAVKGGVESVEVDGDEVRITIKNPVHLLNAVTQGVGLVFPNRAIDKPLSDGGENSGLDETSLVSALDNFFDVYGDRPSISFDRIEPSGRANKHFVKEEVSFRVSEEFSSDEAADSMIQEIVDSEMTGEDARSYLERTSTAISLIVTELGGEMSRAEILSAVQRRASLPATSLFKIAELATSLSEGARGV